MNIIRALYDDKSWMNVRIVGSTLQRFTLLNTYIMDFLNVFCAVCEYEQSTCVVYTFQLAVYYYYLYRGMWIISTTYGAAAIHIVFFFLWGGNCGLHSAEHLGLYTNPVLFNFNGISLLLCFCYMALGTTCN